MTDLSVRVHGLTVVQGIEIRKFPHHLIDGVTEQSSGQRARRCWTDANTNKRSWRRFDAPGISSAIALDSLTFIAKPCAEYFDRKARKNFDLVWLKPLSFLFLQNSKLVDQKGLASSSLSVRKPKAITLRRLIRLLPRPLWNREHIISIILPINELLLSPIILMDGTLHEIIQERPMIQNMRVLLQSGVNAVLHQHLR